MSMEPGGRHWSKLLLHCFLVYSLFQDLGITILNQCFSSWFTELWWFVENHRLDFNKMSMMLSTSNVVVLAGGVFADSLRCKLTEWFGLAADQGTRRLFWCEYPGWGVLHERDHPRVIHGFGVKTYWNKTKKLQYLDHDIQLWSGQLMWFLRVLMLLGKWSHFDTWF